MSRASVNELTLEQIRSMGNATTDQRNELRHLLETRRYPKTWRDRFFDDVWNNQGLSNARAIGALNYLRNQAKLDGTPIHATDAQRDELLELFRTRVAPGPWVKLITRQLDKGTLSYERAGQHLAEARRLPLKEFPALPEQGVKVFISALPDGQYAIRGTDARVRFYKVTTDTAGAREVKHLNGPRRNRMIRNATELERILEQIAVDPAAAAKLYGEESKHCAAPQCNKPLWDKEQPGYEHGFGPDCWKKIVAARKIRDHAACIPDDD